ncbi:MAG: efflux RND transporter periplasmic adaptor subunit [Bacteroidota bacterium]
MPTKYRFLLGVVAVLAAGAYFFLIRGSEGEAATGGGPGGVRGMTQGPVAVDIAPVQKRNFSVRANFVGTLEGIAFAELYPKATGQIVAIYAQTGDIVREGQVLAQIDPSEAQERVRQAQASLRMAEATLAQRDAALTTARLAAERTQSLFDKNLIAEQEQEDRQATLLSARAQYQLAEAGVEQAAAAVSAAMLELENTRVRAPFSGAIGKRFLDAGSMAGANRAVFSIVDLSTIKTTVALVDKDVAFIRSGQPARISVSSLPDQLFEGQVARISPIFNRDTGTADAEIEVSNPDLVLKPGMLVNVSIGYRTDTDALLVPRASLIEAEDNTYLFVAEQADSSEWRARQVPIRVLGTDAALERNLVAVDGSVVEGQQVITLGHESLQDGAAIRPTSLVSRGPSRPNT